ncbi:DUF4105 domain-containing protein [Kistimonas asteriae]|uniref:Lnb N-terminal periplasmic domain-containing protein n=1 Tax=Kistimonas asteriae TaxID=517724 RepID=UPI001BA70E84|nr:DUF4105 domain-containing protein [Kistimonas asteriae]
MSRFLISVLVRQLPAMLLCLFSTAALATPAIEPLARSPMWLKLGHYHSSLMNPSGYTSYVDDPAFFLSKDGDNNPQAELAATIQLFSQPEQTANSQACRFQARYQWLTEQGYTFSSLSCPEYDNWRQQLQAHSVTLAFPAAYMNSPSSMFGHTFLRFDPENIAEDSLWLSWAVNFGATPEGEDNSILYAWKGVAGGYPGKFAMMPYYRKLQEYNRLENRDIWEYRLNLSPEQTAFISSHIWELRDIRFDYYFIDENCSFRLLELLELANPDLDLTSHFPVAAIPVDTVRAVLDADLVQNVHYRPSNATTLHHYLAPLTPPEQTLVYEMALDPDLTDSEAVAHLSEQRQARMIQSSYKYLRYEVNKQFRSPENARNSLALLRGLNRLPPHNITPPVAPEKPEQGHDTSMLALGAGHHKGLGNYVELQGRFTYHDLLDNREGFPQGAEITFGDLRIRGYEDNYWQLEQLDIISIRSQYPRDRFFQPLSWQIQTGLERQPGSDGKEHLAAHINGGAGITLPMTANSQWFGLATLRLEHNSGFDRNMQLAPGINTGFSSRNPLGNWRLEWQLDQFLNGELRSTVSLGQHWELNRNNGLRLDVRYEDQDAFNNHELSLSWRHYF